MTTRTETNGLLRKRRRALTAAVAGCVILVAWMTWLTVRHGTDVTAKDQAQSGKMSAAASASAQASVANQGKALAKDVTKECRSVKFRNVNPTLCVQASVLATATPSPIPGPAGPTGPSGPIGAAASQSQIQTAVDAYLNVHPRPIDYTVLRGFVNSYLAAHPAPSGPVGSPGQSGASGINGASGEPGVSGSSGQSGASGLSGDPGKAGVDAPTVEGITASPDGRALIFTFSSGPAITVPITLPNGCPATATVTPPDPGLAGSPGNPATPYPVCVPN